MRESNQQPRLFFLLSVFVCLLIAVLTGAASGVRAFTGPSGPGGTGSGAIGVDASNNLSMGTSTPSPTTKLIIVASSTGSADFGLRVVQPNGTPILVVRNDGSVGVATSTPNSATFVVQGTMFVTGGFTGSIAAGNVSAGQFAQNTGGGNFAFPASVGVSTSSAVGLPQPLSVYGGGYFSGNVGIGTPSPTQQLELTGNLALPATTSTAGAIFLGSSRVLHGFGPQNVFLGRAAGNLSMTGSDNVGLGDAALQGNTTGVQNMGVGRSALFQNTSGGQNSAIGYFALWGNSTGSVNVAVGTVALQNNKASANTGIGYGALVANTTGADNSGVGYLVLSGNTTGAGNVGLGRNAGSANTIGSNNTFIGYNAGFTGTSANLTNAAAIGYNAQVTQSNSMILGNGVSVGIGTTAPAYKLDVYGDVNASSTVGYRYRGTAGLTVACPAGQVLATTTVSGGIITGGSCTAVAGGTVGGSGTANTVPLWTAGTTLGNSLLTQPSASTIAVGSAGLSVGTTSARTAGDIYATGQIFGSYAGTLNAANVSAGQFGANTGEGNYSFPASLGIGTAAPSDALHVVGDARFAGRKFRNNGGILELTGTDFATTLFTFNNAGTLTLVGSQGTVDTAAGVPLSLNAAGVAGIRVTTVGNVGIGTTGPGAKLHISGTGGPSWRITNSSVGGATWDFGINDSGNVNLDEVGVATRLTVLKTSGNVGVGTTGPTSKFEVLGDVAFTGGSSSTRTFNASNFGLAAGYANPVAGRLLFGNGFGWKFHISRNSASAPADLFTIQDNGNVGIGTTKTSPTYAFDIANDINTDGSYRKAGVAGITVTCPAGQVLATTTVSGGIITGGSCVAVGGGGGVGTSTAPVVNTIPIWTSASQLGNSVITQSGASTIFGGGSGKIDVGTIDPVYTIGGKRYATYVPAMTGVKEETTGVVRVACSAERPTCERTIDFSNVEEGSDLWLFSKTTNLKDNFDKITVLLTPAFNGRAWYEKDSKNNRLTIYAVPRESASSQRESALEVSYRLTAPRFDAGSWSNYYTGDPANAGFILN